MPKKTVNMPKNIKVFILHPPIFIIKLIIFFTLCFFFFFTFLIKIQSKSQKGHCQDKANQINKPMKFFPHISNKSRNKRSCYKIFGNIYKIIAQFLPHASPPILLQWCRCRGGFCLLGHNPIHILR